MSNLGLFNATATENTSDKQRWSVEAVVFSQSADGVGPPLNVNVASAQGGPLALVLTWWAGMLGIEDEEMFVEEVCQHILDQLRMIAV